MEYETPELKEYGAVETVTEGSGSNKSGASDDEFSGSTSLTGSIY